MHPSFQAKLLTEHMDVLGRAKFLRVQVDYTTVIIAQAALQPNSKPDFSDKWEKIPMQSH